MKILLISPFIPYPLDSGGNQAFFNMVDSLRMEHEISFVVNCSDTRAESSLKDLKKLWKNVNFYPYKEIANNSVANGGAKEIKRSIKFRFMSAAHRSLTRKINRYNNKILSVGSDEIVRKYASINETFGVYSRGYMEHIWNVSRMGFDIIQLEFYYCLPMVYLLPEDVKKVFVHHEIRFVRNENELSLLENPTLADRYNVLLDKDRERAALLHFDDIIVLTEIDKAILEEFIGKKNIYVSPAVLSGKLLETKFKPTKKDLVFLGSGYHFPNHDAINWFVDSVAPILAERGVDFKLHIASEWDKSVKQKIVDKCSSVKFTGFIDNLQDFLCGKISIVPIRIGSGMRIKILDAINANSVFVTTRKGVEGLDFRDKEECLIADTAEAFAESIISLLSNEDRQKELAESAKSRFAELLSTEKLLKIRADFYKNL